MSSNSRGSGTTALVFGLLSLIAQVSVICRLIFIIVAKKCYRKSIGTAGEGAGKAGKVMANISFILMFGWIIVLIGIIIAVIALGGFSALLNQVQSLSFVLPL